MSYEFRGSSEELMANCLADLATAASGDGANEAAHFRRALVALVGLHHLQAASGPVSAERMRAFREQSLQSLLGQRTRVRQYYDKALDLAEIADEGDWPELCMRRSVVQCLLEDFADTPLAGWISADEIAGLDEEMMRVGDEQGPVDAGRVPGGLPLSHWWWHYPKDEGSADRPHETESQQDARVPEETPAARGTLVLDPQYRFDNLRDGLAELGWQVVDLSHQPIVPGEPEHALFERDGRHLAYSFNPVCRLRLIEVPLDLDNPTVARLPVQDVGDVNPWLLSEDERTQLRGILAAAHLPHPQLLAGVEQLLNHPRASIARAAQQSLESIRSVLAADDRSRATALAAIEVLKQELTPLIQALASVQGQELTTALRPQPGDYARAFEPEIVEQARTIYETLWAHPPRVERSPAGSQLKLAIAPAGMLLEKNELSREFPGGYRAIAPLLNPHRVWVAWKLIPPGKDAGMAYDGLVWLDDHWAWFPKPYRALADLLRSGAS